MENASESTYEPTKGIEISNMTLANHDLLRLMDVLTKRGDSLRNLIPGCTFHHVYIKGVMHMIMMSADKSTLYATTDGIKVYRLAGDEDAINKTKALMDPLRELI